LALVRELEFQSIERVVRVLYRESIDSILHLDPDPGLRIMGYSTFQTLHNTSAVTQAAYFGAVLAFPPSDALGIVFASEEPLLVQSEDGGPGVVNMPYAISKGWMGVFNHASGRLTLVKSEMDPRGVGEIFRLVRMVVPGGWEYKVWGFPPVAVLPSRGCLNFRQLVLHCSGPRASLDTLCMAFLGVTTGEMKPA
jgi:hypothetical protein